MDKKDFLKIMQQIKNAYGDRFQITDDILLTWYECLKDLEVRALHQTVIEWAKENRYPPTISELRNACKMNQSDGDWQ